MAYYIDNNIVKETKAPQKFSLSGKPNFLEFESSTESINL